MEQNQQQQKVNGVYPRSDNSFLCKSKFDWSDVQIVKQYDGKPSVLNLKYTPDYEELMDYFRGILHSGEISERAYEISGLVVDKLASNYNAWYLRQLCIEKLDSITYQQELDFVNDLIQGNEKVFQIWDHRKYLIEKLNDPIGEIDFLEDVFEQENKNYHAWSHRIWLCQQFDLYESEWNLLPKYFTEDLLNNSAWNYRFFLFKNKFYNPEQQNIKDELKFAFEKILIKPDNEAGWNYLSGFFANYEFKTLKQEFQNQQKSDLNVFSQKISQHNYYDFPEVETFCQELLKHQPRNRFLINIMIEILLNKKEITQQNINQVLTYTEYLASDIDKIRFNYWKWVGENIQSDFSEILEQNQEQKSQEQEQI